ncbi:hypothetical protein [Cellulomonas cellasea]|uniref:Uncharacterized protein n=2 Tax=Cellulomonas cellasea TaxID=43670 RepID=A0A0A0BA96_9CELL|nr:hypothetical protein [Cellulomonas cellasea]KGM03093.1 hypothetical protein Q760_09575 [Cellulomonas cellasea DSM 20118]GEA87868.1 hypothetical protein CCE01nite_18170 [Cellulomonas cellasea]
MRFTVDDNAVPGGAARALLDAGSDAYAALPADDLREGVVELVVEQEAAYPEHGSLDIEGALTRVLALGVPDVDVRLVERLADGPSAARLGVTCQALRQLWSPAHPHPAPDPVVVGRLVGSAARVALGPDELVAYRAALELAAARVGSPGVAAAIEREITRLDAAASGG